MASNVITCPACGTRNRVPAVASGTPTCAKCKKPLPWITAADDETFDQVADSSKVTVLVDLWAPWCGPCRQVGPVLEQSAAENAGRLKLVKVNVDENPETPGQFNIMSIPTFIIFKGGKPVSSFIGAKPKESVKQEIDRAIA